MRIYVAKSNPEKILVSAKIGIDHQVTAISLPNIGFGIIAVGNPISKKVIRAVNPETIQRIDGQLRKESSALLKSIICLGPVIFPLKTIVKRA